MDKNEKIRALLQVALGLGGLAGGGYLTGSMVGGTADGIVSPFGGNVDASGWANVGGGIGAGIGGAAALAGLAAARYGKRYPGGQTVDVRGVQV